MTHVRADDQDEQGTAATETMVNCIEIVGTIVPLQATPRGNAAPVVTTVPPRARYAVHCQRLMLHVHEEDGARYALPLDVPISTPAQQADIDACAHGDRVRVRGHVRMDPTFDRRFATAANPDGRPTSMLVIAVDTVTPASEADIEGSWVRLRGRISVPPTIRFHERTPTEEIARTSLVVETVLPSRRPGSRQQWTRIDRIPLDVPLQIVGSANALRAGNEVMVEGRLEPFQRVLRPHADAFVQQHHAALQAQWQAEPATLNEREQAHRAHDQVQQLRRVSREHRLRVRAGFVELIDGHVLSVAEARATHAAWVAQQKQRRRAHTGVPPDASTG